MGANSRFSARVPVAVLAAAAAASGCLVAGAGAGAGGAVYFTSRGVESVVTAPVETVAGATDEAFRHFRIQRTELRVEGDGARQEFRGREPEEDREITVSLRRQAESSTRVEVTARTGLVTWDKEYARQVIEKIVELSR